MQLELSSVFYVDFTITPPSFFCTTHKQVMSHRVLCNCHEVSKVSSDTIGNILDGDHRGSNRKFFITFLQVSFSFETFVFISINKSAGPL